MQNEGQNEPQVEPQSETQNEKQNESQNEKGQGANYSLNLAVLGGLIGAGIGLLATPENGKKAVRNLGESEFVKAAGKEFKKTAQELLADQAQSSFKQLAMGYINKVENGILSPGKGKESGASAPNTATEGQSSEYEDIKEENKHLNERLEKIEKMLGELVESK
ncbi:gas vesicle protein GvpP [Lysinibacillus yapensis]|uniref:Gas vesicle protein GvpP n=2 Tax=Ureibacillus yapensis TaxID=2304605 RepID=A0A396SIY0_9BACL|nr:gas vesicle protein GvpP [Lysinibacillus yapensis]